VSGSTDALGAGRRPDIHAFNESQRYKVGKVILERAYIKKIPEVSAALRSMEEIRRGEEEA
jgi:hypothetical protein